METNNAQNNIFSKKEYIMEFKKRIVNQAFKYQSSTYFCNDAKYQNDKLVIYTSTRTLVLLFSQLQDITILSKKSEEPTKIVSAEKKEQIQEAKKALENYMHKDFNKPIVKTITTIQDGRFGGLKTSMDSETRKKYYDMFFLKNKTNNRIRFTEEEDQLILDYSPSFLSDVIGRDESSISARKFYLKKKNSDKNSNNFSKIDNIINQHKAQPSLREESDIQNIINNSESNQNDQNFDEPKLIDINTRSVTIDKEHSSNRVFTPRQDLFILGHTNSACKEMFGSQFAEDELDARRQSLANNLMSTNPDIFIKLR